MAEDRVANHLRKTCKIDEKAYAKVVRKLNQILPRCETIDELQVKFAAKCYKKEPDRERAKVQAGVFLETLFGSLEILLDHGPRYALATRLKITIPKVEELDQLDDRKEVEKNHLWTKKLGNYLIGPTLGKGGTAKVKLALDTKTQEKIALKILDPKFAKTAKKELNILKDLNHINIVKVYNYFDHVRWNDADTCIFVLEYASQGELIEYLMYTGKFKDKLARWFFRSLTDAVEYCHNRNIVHRDLKHDNCLLGKNFVLKVTDFGFATYYYDEMMKTAVGTKQYAAPEVLRKDKYTPSVDIFSMGVMLFIALAGTQPWREANPFKDRWYKMVHRGKWDSFFDYHERSQCFSRDQETILKGMLEPDYEKRWTLRQIRRCKWFNGIAITQDDAAMRLQKLKIQVDEKKFIAMEGRVVGSRKAVDIFSQKLPCIYFQPAPPLSFLTDKKAEWVLEDIATIIVQLKGTIELTQKEKYKLTFHINKMVDIDNGLLDKKTRKKQFDKVQVPASVQMWTLPGQQDALAARSKALAAVPGDVDKLTDKEREKMAKDIPKIKSIAVFRSEGNSEAKYLFPQIYSDILERLNAEIIYKDVIDSDDLKEE